MLWHKILSRCDHIYWSRKEKIGARSNSIAKELLALGYFGPKYGMARKTILRKYRAVNLPSTPKFISESKFPSIAVTIDCGPKDIHLIDEVIRRTIVNSINPISSIYVVCPIENKNQILKKIGGRYEGLVEVIDENKVLSYELRNRITELFPNRYGWVLHQFSTLQQVLSLDVRGVLQLDADTLLLRPIAFMSESGSQILMESLEFHQPYYDILQLLDPGLKPFPGSHVTHHSFFQRTLLLQILRKIEVVTLSDLLEKLGKFSDKNSNSPFCVDRELYAYGLIRYFPDKVEKIKFSNKSQYFDEITSQERRQLDALAHSYNSVSSHWYLK